MLLSNFIEKIDITVKGLLDGICAGLCVYYLYAGFFGFISPLWQMLPLLMIGLVLAFVNYPLFKKNPLGWTRLIDYFLALLVIVPCLIIQYNLEQKVIILEMLPTGCLLIFSWVIIFLVLEATRRVIGLPLPVIAIIFTIYSRWGNYVPGMFHSRGYEWDYVSDFVSLGFDGIFGMPLTVCGTVIVYFLIFAAFLKATGADMFFNDIALSLFGRFRGGPAKISVVGSGLFGMVSGSAVANVTVDGIFTIPLMHKIGFSWERAGAIEALSSTGGQFMPPVMGAAAFLMAEVMGVSYWSVAVAAFLPATLYYISLFMVVDFEAFKVGMKGIPKEELLSVRKAAIKGWSVIIPLAVLMYGMGVARVSATRSVLLGLISLVVVSFFTKETRLNGKKLFNGLADSIKDMTMVTLTCACAGIVIGNIYLNNSGVVITGALVEWSHGNMLLLLILSAATSLLLGMGITTSACYLLLAILVAPALVNMGAVPMAAHLFVLYFGCLSTITPPVALASYAAAAIAKCNPMRLGYAAMRLGMIAYILPFIWVYEPALILQGGFWHVLIAFVTSIIGVVGFAGMIQGCFFFGRTNIVQRLLLGLGGLCLIIPGWRTDLVGLALLAFVWLWQKKVSKGKKA